MRKSSDNNARNENIDIILHSKPVIIVFSISALILLSMLTVKIVVYIQNVQFEKQLEKERNSPLPTPELQLKVSDLKYGKYYLNGDKNSYYFQINEDNTLELVSDDLYGIFEKWNPGREDAIQLTMKDYTGPKHYEVKESPDGSLLLVTDKIFDEEAHTYIGGVGPRVVDYNTLQWGKEGDFIYIAD